MFRDILGINLGLAGNTWAENQALTTQMSFGLLLLLFNLPHDEENELWTDR